MKPIGRVWKRNGSLSGYIIVGENVCIKFGGSIHEGSNFLFLSKSQREDFESSDEVFEQYTEDCDEALTETLKEEAVTYNGIAC
jgi:hypothetical protein